ncbi:hypothetical protein F966_01386 [Acinetobacter higginsii]|uniref:Thymidylate synthase/dCMP hydroxymethylase domain-containing protein n=1 Tax=Acinetobacter higginsii TaxID=70347 RepID=N8XS12_9GAMM|nr:thymidylate synthase [Acinetobacter higginsii]ENV10213.1 hypothetical protein F966_01386 [Acinetobacter higginsii]
MHITEESLDDLLHKTYQYILENGETVIPTKGVNKEVRNCVLTLLNPRSRISLSEVRSKVISCVGEFIWYLTGSSSIDFIEYYIKHYRKRIGFDKDSTDSVPGAYGPRIFGSPSQFDTVFELLKNSDSTRRAVIAIYSKSDLINHDPRDIPCTCNLQFFIRQNKLHLTTYMRSNDAALGLVHDIFSFTLIQEIMFAKLLMVKPELQLGEYTHIVGSLHIYEDDFETINHYLNREGWHYHVSMPPINPKYLNTSISQIIEIEKNLRVDNLCDIHKLELIKDNAFKEMAAILYAYHYIKPNSRNIESLKSLEDKCLSEPIKAFLNKRIQELQMSGDTQ